MLASEVTSLLVCRMPPNSGEHILLIIFVFTHKHMGQETQYKHCTLTLFLTSGEVTLNHENTDFSHRDQERGMTELVLTVGLV